jgi:type I restriction enzyme S subunit
MVGEWRDMPFSEAVTVNPRVQLARGSEYPFVDMQAVSAGSRCAYASERRSFEGGGSRFAVGDTLMARITPCLENGKIARFCADPDAIAHGSTEFIVIRGRDATTETDFAYYLTKWDGVSGYAISQMTGTSGRQRVPTEAFDHLLVPVPPLPEQRAIAHILGTLDDKIERNRRMNETLEAMARALFKSWFVDFDPVCAKAEGRDPGLPQPLADLFPDFFEDSELGEIPKGWRVGSVDDEFDLIMGQSPPGETYNEVGMGLPFYQGCTDFGFRFPTRRIYCTAPTRLGKAGDVLVSVRAPVGDINMATEDCAIGRGVAAVRHKTGSRSYSYQFMQSIEKVFTRFEAEGTVFGSIGKKDFHAIASVNPPHKLVLAYEAHVSPLDGRVEVNERESRTLAALRDTLLPKLISGALRVQDTAAFLGGRA